MTGATFSRGLPRSAAWAIFDEGTAWALANAREARGTVEAGRHRRPMMMRGFDGALLPSAGFAALTICSFSLALLTTVRIATVSEVPPLALPAGRSTRAGLNPKCWNTSATRP